MKETKVVCTHKGCKNNRNRRCIRISLHIIASPLYPDLARCTDFEEKAKA